MLLHVIGEHLDERSGGVRRHHLGQWARLGGRRGHEQWAVIGRSFAQGLEQVARRIGLPDETVWQTNLEDPVDPEHQLSAPEAVEAEVAVKIAVELDRYRAPHMRMQLPNQLLHEAKKSGRKLRVGLLEVVGRRSFLCGCYHANAPADPPSEKTRLLYLFA